MFPSGTSFSSYYLNGYLLDENYFSSTNYNTNTNSNSSVAIMDYTSGYSQYDDCEYINSLPVGTILHNPLLGSSGIIIAGKECGSNLQSLINASNESASITDNFSKYYIALFSLTDTIFVDALHTWNNGIAGYKQLLYCFGDEIDNFDPNILSNIDNEYGIICEICSEYQSGTSEEWDDAITIETPNINLLLNGSEQTDKITDSRKNIWLFNRCNYKLLWNFSS